ncbi:16S rRNA (guanine(966)-N(2))-methyltransferase [hydrothermal vent metagenome]|uniref:16S rRNA (Guanine(966)-N(2))-methyltransferase n=1 Tax=hydrothermal vent metagenome TaxID=652676 RepID=A0A3B0Z5M4_9ZZZZ
MSSSRQAKTEVRELRIIGGQWRSRKLRFDALPGVRPTPDRVRETLFNWLQAWVSGSRCLDMFAGSGVLGFESLSRGAHSVVFIDEQARVVARLRDQAQSLEALNVEVVRSSAIQWLKQKPGLLFDIIFIDPPYGKDLIADILQDVVAHCSSSARIYIEAEKALDEAVLPSGWAIEKSKQAASVYFHLLHRVER